MKKKTGRKQKRNPTALLIFHFISRMWKLVLVATLAAHSILVNCDQIFVRSHGEASAEPEPGPTTFEKVVGLKVAQPKRRLRVRTRVPKKDTTTEAIEAARAAGLVAKELQHKSLKDANYRDLEPIESSHVPVSYFWLFFLDGNG